MGFWDNVVMALASIRANKMRSLLTMLGIIIGIAAVIAIQTVGDSLSGSMTDEFASFGATNITVSLTTKSSDSDSDEGMMGGWNNVDVRMFGDSTPAASDLISDEMIQEYQATFPDKIGVIEISESLNMAEITCQYDSGTTVQASFYGANLGYMTGEEIECIYGRSLNQQDLDDKRHVAVVSDQFVKDAMDCTPVDAVGQSFVTTLNNQIMELYVVGVYHYDSDNSYSTWGSDDSIVTDIYLPLTFAKQLLGSDPGYRSLTVRATTGTDTANFLTTTGDFFASYYTRNSTWTVQATSMESMLESLTSMMNTLSLGISAIAAIALLVGGIGVMNIMTVSVTERTREIGTRKALGAPGSAIRAQFIIEAMVICLIGGIIGVILGVGGGSLASKALGYAARPGLYTILIAVGFSMAIGVFFGYYPANKAAKLDPIEALRYE